METEIKVGQVWKDRDPRQMGCSTFTIVGVEEQEVIVKGPFRMRHIKKSRLRPIGKTKGYELMTEAPPTSSDPAAT